MFPQEKSKGSAPDLFFLREEGTSVHRLLLQGISKQISAKPVIIRFSRDTERKILRKRPKNNNKKSMNKDVWSYFKHFGRLPGKIHLFLTPSKTYWRMKRFPASTRHRQKYITHWRSTLRVIDRTRGDWFSHNCSSTCPSTLLTDFFKNFTWNNIVFLVCNQFTMPKERTEVSCCVKYLLFFFNVFFWVSLFEKWQK